jgi:hypothetical protein
VIGKRKSGDDPDRRTGTDAWGIAPYTHHTKAATRAYFKRMQRALHAGVAVEQKKRVTMNDLYVDYLTGTVRVCPDGAPSTSSKCHDVVPLEDVTLPSGF